MPLDFNVIIRVRQRFGDNESEDIGLETEAPFVGLQRDYQFQCPDVDNTQEAILLYQSQGVGRLDNRMEINSQVIFGGIPRSVDIAPTGFGSVSPISSSVTVGVQSVAPWNGNIMLVRPGVLQENNVLRIRAGGPSSNPDNFVIDNLVIVFKTR